MSKLVSVKIEFTIEVEDELFENYNTENDLNQLDEVIDEFITDNADILEYEIVRVDDFPEGE